jgi:hypothetical protein
MKNDMIEIISITKDLACTLKSNAIAIEKTLDLLNNLIQNLKKENEKNICYNNYTDVNNYKYDIDKNIKRDDFYNNTIKTVNELFEIIIKTLQEDSVKQSLKKLINVLENIMTLQKNNEENILDSDSDTSTKINNFDDIEMQKTSLLNDEWFIIMIK